MIKIIALMFCCCGYGVDKAISELIIEQGMYVIGILAILLSIVFMYVSYLVILRRVKAAHSAGLLEIHGISTKTWLLLPGIAYLVGMPIGLFYSGG